MASNNVTLYSSFNPSNLRFGSVEKNKKGGRLVNVYDPSSNGPMLIQSPPCRLPFGVSAYTDPISGSIQSYSLDLSFSGADTDSKMACFLEKMTEMDQLIRDTAVANSQAWFGKAHQADFLEELYRPLVKPPSDKKYAPTLKTKISVSGGEPNVLVFDTNKKPCLLSDIPKGAVVRAIFQIGSVWFVSKNYGITLRVVQVGIVSLPTTISNTFSFVDEETGANLLDAGEGPSAAAGDRTVDEEPNNTGYDSDALMDEDGQLPPLRKRKAHVTDP